MKAVVAAFNQEKALVGAFSVIVQLHRLIDLRHYLGVIGPGQVPGDALGLLLLFCPLNWTLHDTIIKWIFLEQLEVSLIRKQTSSPFWINIFDSMIRTVTGCFIHCRLQYYIKSPDEGWCDHNFTLMSWWQGYLAAAKVAGCVFWRSNQNLEWP